MEATFAGKDEHELVIPIADLRAKVEKTYDVQGIAGHAHGLTVTPADMEKLLAGKQVNLRTSVGDEHTHLVFVRYLVAKG